MPQQNDEAQVRLALQAIENDPKLSLRAAAKIYSVTPGSPPRPIPMIESLQDTKGS